MKIKVDIPKLRTLMRERGIRNYAQLAEECGINKLTLYGSKSHTGTFSKEIMWLISDALECSINDFVYPDWEDGA